MRWMSIISGRSFLRALELAAVSWVSLFVFCRSLASGWVENGTGKSSAELFASELSEAVDHFLCCFDATFLAAEGFAQSGTGYIRLN